MLFSVLILLALFAAWAILHSLLAASSFKDLVIRWFGPGASRWYRLAYNLLAMASLLPVLLLLMILPDQVLYAVPSPWNWAMRGLQVLALLGLFLAFAQTDLMHFVGLAQLSGRRADMDGNLVVGGFYCRVRHPLYFFSILLVWLTPTMTVNWLSLCVLFTLYFYVGSLHEEQRLLRHYGAAYAQYQRQVPMLFPRPGRCIEPLEISASQEVSRTVPPAPAED